MLLLPAHHIRTPVSWCVSGLIATVMRTFNKSFSFSQCPNSALVVHCTFKDCLKLFCPHRVGRELGNTFLRKSPRDESRDVFTAKSEFPYP